MEEDEEEGDEVVQDDDEMDGREIHSQGEDDVSSDGADNLYEWSEGMYRTCFYGVEENVGTH